MGKYRINNKLVVITGASGGFGRELTRRLVKFYGCRVIGIGRNEDKLRALSEELGVDKFSYRVFDVTDSCKWDELKEEFLKKEIYPDVLINNAGYLLSFAKAGLHTREQAKDITDTNYLSATYSFGALLPLLRQSASPAVINISSLSALAPITGTALYSASKAALKSYTEVIALDYPEIYIAGVYPGFMKTDILSRQKAGTDSKIIQKFCAPADKAAKKALKKITRRKRKIILGKDAKALNFFYGICPKITSSAVRKVLKNSGLEIFKEVF